MAGEQGCRCRVVARAISRDELRIGGFVVDVSSPPQERHFSADQMTEFQRRISAKRASWIESRVVSGEKAVAAESPGGSAELFRGRHDPAVSAPYEGETFVPQRLVALLAAWKGGGDASDAVWEAGSLYALDGESLRVLLDDVDRTRHEQRLPSADLGLVRALALAWSEAALGRYARLTCTDPLTGLATAQHLQTQVVSLSRRRESGAWALAIVDIGPGTSSTETSHVPRGMFELIGMSQVAAAVTREVAADVIVARLAPRRCAVLVPQEEATGLVMRIDRRIREHFSATRTWVERLPDEPARAAALIDELCR